MTAAGVSLFAPVGPVAEAFVRDTRIVRAIMGPYGSAKTTSCIRVIAQSAMLQNPGPDGVRRARWCVVRDTYAQLETNVLNSWFTWFPKTKDNWNGREMCHRLNFEVALLDGSPPQRISLEVYFRAMGDQKAEDVLKGLELTGLWLNEVDTLDKSVLRFGLPRCGRYPSAKDGGCQWYGVIADFNAPDIDNWTYELLVEGTLPIDGEALESLREKVGQRFGIGFHRQPGGRSIDPAPENIANLPAGYYDSMTIGMSDNDIRRFVDNEFGAVRNGQPVYPEYNDTFHCAKEPLRPVTGAVAMAIDAGSTPAAVFGEKTDFRQIRTLSEVVVFAGADESLEKLGPEAFGRMCGEHWLERYARQEFGGAWGDPAAFYGQDDTEYSWIKLFWKEFVETLVRGGIKAARGWRIRPAPVKANRLPERIETVRRGLVMNADGGQPGQLISPECRMLRRGFNNAYVITRVQMSHGRGAWRDVPDKGDASHVHDAKQYLDLGLTKRGVLDDGDGVRPARREVKRKVRGRVDFGQGQFAHRELING